MTQRIFPGLEKADMLIGSLLSIFGTQIMAQFVNVADVPPLGKGPFHRMTVVRCTKNGFGLICGK